MVRAKELREARGLSMKEASRLLDMPYTTYVNYEKCLREPSFEVLIQVANFFEVSIDYLVGRSNDVHNGDLNLTSDELNVLHRYRSLDESAKSRIRNMLDYEYCSILGDAVNCLFQKV